MDAATATMVRNIAATTGRTVEEWVDLIGARGLEKHGEILKVLKGEYGFTHGYANLVAHAARGGLAASAESTEAAEAAVFDGSRAAVQPVYDVVRHAIVGMGPDVEVAPKKSYVSFRRKKQFALAQPTTTRLDLGLNLRGVEPGGRLEASGGFNAMCTHRVRLERAEDVDAEVMEWIRAAWEAAG